MKNILFILITMLTLGYTGYGQSGVVQVNETNVKVNVIGGSSISGKLISANRDAVVIDIGSGEATIKTDKIISIVFREIENSVNNQTAAEKPAEKKNNPQIEAAQKIITALRRLDNAVAVGVMFQNYSALLIDVKSIVDENISISPEGEFRTEAYECLTDHQYAMDIWNLAVGNGWSFFTSKQEPGRTLISKYGVPIKISVWKNVPVDIGRRHVWLSSNNHFNKAVNQLKILTDKEPK